MPFVKVRTKKKSDCIAEQILTAIHGGIYQMGDKLPSEQEMAEKTGTSRASVREALSALRLAGIVESITGNGIYIRRTNVELGESVPLKMSMKRSRRRHI